MIVRKKGLLYSLGFLLLFTVMTTAVGIKWEDQDSLVAYLHELGFMNQETVELLQEDCVQEWLHSKKNQQIGLEFLLERSINENPASISDGAVKSFMHLLDELLINCARGKDLMLSDGLEEICSDSWLTRHFGFLFNHHCSSARRALVQVSAEAPAPATSPSPAPATSPSPAPATLPSPANELPSYQIPAGTQNIPNNTSERHNRQTRRRTVVVIAVVLTVALSFVSLLLVCLGCCCFGSSRRKTDERPLLSLSSSVYSEASSHKLGQRSQLIEEKLNDQPFSNRLNRSKVGEGPFVESDFMKNSRTEASGASLIMAADNSSMPPRLWDGPVFPPLKPPPGRAEPRKQSAPPARPLPMPPSLKKSSSSGIEQLKQNGPHPVSDGITHGHQVSATSAPRPPPPPPPPGPGAPPPPPPGAPRPPPRPPLHQGAGRGAIGARASQSTPPLNSGTLEDEAAAAKTKLKPFFWDKVMANPDHSMVWDQIKSGSFQFDEEMIENLFGYAASEKNKAPERKGASPSVRIIDPKKAQNLSILLKALNVTKEEVCDALNEGNELPPEFIQTLLKMTPTPEEESKLRAYSGSVAHLDAAERFLKVLVEVPFAFKRLESLHFMCTAQEEMSMLKESFSVLEAACTELRKSRLFLKLLEAVLKTGNRMNDGTFRGGAQAFKLDTLLKLSDVKGTDGKTTLLHFVVEEIIRSEGVRAAKESSSTPVLDDSDEELRRIGLQVVSSLGDELRDVKKAAVLDLDSLKETLVKLGKELVKAKSFLNSDMRGVAEEKGFQSVLRKFVEDTEVSVVSALEEESRMMALVKSTAAYFHGNSGKDEGLRLFVVVRDFLVILDRVCRQVAREPRNATLPSRKEEKANTGAAPTASPDLRQRIFPAITERRMEDSSSGDES